MAPVDDQLVQDPSGLHDIRKLAQSTIEHQTEKRSQDAGEVAESLFASASPAALGRVLLPAPKESPSAPLFRSRVGLFLGASIPAVIAVFATIALLGRSNGSDGASKRNEEPAKPMPVVATAAPISKDVGRDGAHLAFPSDSPKEASKAEESKKVESSKIDLAKKIEKPSAGARVVVPVVAGGEASHAPKAEEHPAKLAVDSATKGGHDELDALLDDTAGPKKMEKSAQSEQEKPKDQHKAAGGDLPAALARDDVIKGMTSVRARVQTCYDKFKMAGTITVKVRIDPNGSVAGAEAVDSKFKGSETGACVAQAVEHASFRKFSGAAMTINYPFKLQ